eukprot:851287-Prymnesium_polylepis.2
MSPQFAAASFELAEWSHPASGFFTRIVRSFSLALASAAASLAALFAARASVAWPFVSLDGSRYGASLARSNICGVGFTAPLNPVRGPSAGLVMLGTPVFISFSASSSFCVSAESGDFGSFGFGGAADACRTASRSRCSDSSSSAVEPHAVQ